MENHQNYREQNSQVSSPAGFSFSSYSPTLAPGSRCLSPLNLEECTTTGQGPYSQDLSGAKPRCSAAGGRVIQLGGYNVPCPRKSMCLPPVRQTASERRLATRGGPEGLGDTNDIDDRFLNDCEYNRQPSTQGSPQRKRQRRARSTTITSSSVPIPESQPMSPAARTIVASIASVARDFIQLSTTHAKVVTSVSSLLETLTKNSSPVTIQHAHDDQDIALMCNLASSCIEKEIDEAISNFQYWVTTLMLSSVVNKQVL